MKSQIIRWLAVFLVLEVGIIHFLNAQHEFEEVPYLGYLFMANFLLAGLAGYGIYQGYRWGWWMGIFVSAGSLAGYVWSRTVGLPGAEVEPWLTTWGLASLAAELLFTGLGAFVLLRGGSLLAPPVHGTFSLETATRFLVVIGLCAANTGLILLGGDESHAAHQFSLHEVLLVRPISEQQLETEYGLRVDRAAISMMGGIVDVRVRVLDPEKAYQLTSLHPSILVGDDLLISAPNMHSHSIKRTQKVHILFFPTENGAIHAGSEISLVFGGVRLEPVTVK